LQRKLLEKESGALIQIMNVIDGDY